MKCTAGTLTIFDPFRDSQNDKSLCTQTTNTQMAHLSGAGSPRKSNSQASMAAEEVELGMRAQFLGRGRKRQLTSIINQESFGRAQPFLQLHESEIIRFNLMWRLLAQVEYRQLKK